jgi:ribosome biogenesis GTPase
LKEGIVIKSTGSWYTVKADDNECFECKIKGKFRLKGIKTTNPLAVGDRVHFKLQNSSSDESGEQIGIISKITPRKNYIIRKSSNLSKQAHIIAANIDQAFLVVTVAFPVTTATFIDRFLVSAEAYRIPVRLVFNKIDRYDEDQQRQLDELIELYELIGYTCYKTSVKENIGVDKVSDAMKGKVNVFAGHSGVGKSSFINTIDPNLDIKTKEISDYHNQGVHTTTFSQMHEVANGSYIIDTPGIRGFGVIDMEKEEISHYFPEMFEKLEECQFNNCTHTHEPNCAIKVAVENGEISFSRYNSYLGLLEGDEDKHRLK